MRGRSDLGGTLRPQSPYGASEDICDHSRYDNLLGCSWEMGVEMVISPRHLTVLGILYDRLQASTVR